MTSAGATRPDDEGDPGNGLLAIGALVLAVAAILAVTLLRGSSYRVTAEFQNAGQLVRGNEVRVAGAKVGTVKEIDVSQDGMAEVTFEVGDEEYVPLRTGTQAVVKLGSLSGIANRYIDLQLGPDDGNEIDDGGRIDADHTSAAVEIDQVFNIFDERTRTALQDVVAGSATSLKGRGTELRAGIHYLNPALSTGARLFGVLSRDDRLLRRVLVNSSELVTALGQRRRELHGAVSGLGATFSALGRQKAALAESVERLPPFLRRANSTFVDLRAALDDVDPLVAAAKPVATTAGAVSRPGPRVRAGRRAHDPRSLADDSRPGRQQRPDRGARELPGARALGTRRHTGERRRAPRGLPRDGRRVACRRPDARARAAVHAGLRGLARRLLHHRRL